jgi:hypothetical protein
MQTKWTIAILLTLVGGFFAGCQQDSANQTTESTQTVTPGVDAAKYLLAVEPEGADDVIAVREAASDGDDVLVVGRIGGGENPWVDGRAAFSIVDTSLKACSDIPGDMCETPWDYCCETPKLPSSTALIKVVGEDGDLVRADARELLKVKELSTVVVKGKAQRDDTGNLTVLATGVYVKKQ